MIQQPSLWFVVAKKLSRVSRTETVWTSAESPNSTLKCGNCDRTADDALGEAVGHSKYAAPCDLSNAPRITRAEYHLCG